jgi:UDP-N-acetylmuramoylalanine--D-glutamate ligase
MSWSGRRVLVLGLGRSGAAAAGLLARRGARVTAYDADASRAPQLDAAIEIVHGERPPPFERFERVVASPGFRLAPDPRILPEVELAAGEIRAPLVAVTGTNGKSTTTVLIGEMLRRAGQRVEVGGNLGTALSELVEAPADRFVVELSSFQLEHAQALHADVAVLLNLAPDHLDRHGSLAAYAAAKARLAEMQGPEAALVANLDDAWARRVAAGSKARVVTFSERERTRTGAFIDGKDLVVASEGRETLRLGGDALSTASRTPIANALAAASAAQACGAPPDAIAAALEQFEGLPHRSSPVCTRRGVRYVDDSKATNPAAAAASLRAQGAPTVWLAGGRNKGLDFAPLREAARGVRVGIFYGEAAAELQSALASALPARCAATLDEAVQIAAHSARAGEVVLLSPACSSFDQFESFEARGAHFAELARALPDGDAPTEREAKAC